jgi:hypothetical protein
VDNLARVGPTTPTHVRGSRGSKSPRPSLRAAAARSGNLYLCLVELIFSEYNDRAGPRSTPTGRRPGIRFMFASANPRNEPAGRAGRRRARYDGGRERSVGRPGTRRVEADETRSPKIAARRAPPLRSTRRGAAPLSRPDHTPDRSHDYFCSYPQDLGHRRLSGPPPDGG